MAIDWIYDTTYVSFGVEWNAAYKAVGKVTIQPVVYRWDRYNTADGSKFSETLRYEPNGSTGSWSNIGWGSGSGTRSVDTFGVRTYQRQASAYTVQLQIATDSGFGTAYDGYFHTIGEVTRTATYTVPALPPTPPTPALVAPTDNSATLSWGYNPSGNIAAVCIERSVDGGSYSEIAVLWSSSATSYTDSSTTAGHVYRYRIRYHHNGAYGDYSYSTWLVNTPPAPTSITTQAIQGSTNINVELENPATAADGIEWQISDDGGDNWSASTRVAGTPTETPFVTPVTSFVASTSLGGTVRLRVRNYVDDDVDRFSDWLVSEQVTTICPPAAPTLISPTGVLDMSGGSVTFEWRHNPLDGSTQTAAQLDYSTNGGSTWTTVTKSTEESHTITPIPWAAGTTVTWRVRTKGADANYGDWAQAVQLDVYTAPTLSITSPGATITGMPISLTATYSDMAGFTCQAATVSLTKDGRTLYSENAAINGTSITSSLDVSEFLPTNGETYTVVLTSRSSSGLQTTANATFLVDFVEPQAGELSIVNDPETGYVSLLATFDNSASEITYAGSTNEQFESTEGYVRSLTVEGKSEKWNQHGRFVKLADASTDKWGSAFNSFTVASDGLSASVSNKRLPNTNFGISAEHRGHKLYFSMDVAVTWMFTNRFVVNFGGTIMQTALLLPNVSNHITAIGTMGTSYNYVYIYPNGTSDSQAVTCDYTFANFNLVDLTAIFGAGNEPATVDAFQATDIYKAKLAAGELYAYNAGSLVSIEGMSVGDGTITTTLRSAGSVHDTLMADADSWTVERRVGVVDLGSLTWTASGNYFYAPLSGKAYGSDNVLAANYATALDYSDMTVRGYDTSNRVAITDSRYSTAAALTTALSGVYLFYELATPTTDPETSMSRIEIGSAFTVETELNSTFELTTWDGSADAVSVSVSRVNADGTITPLLTDGASGSGLVDRYAPLNTPYQYAVTTTADTQAVKTVYVDNELVTDLWFVYWGDNIAKAKWNPDNGGIQVTRPQKTRVYYAGRRDPVSYDGHAVSLTETPSWMFLGKDEVDTFVQLIEDGGRGIYKSCDGWVYHADFDLTMTPSYTAIGYYGGASLGITRIAGERL